MFSLKFPVSIMYFDGIYRTFCPVNNFSYLLRTLLKTHSIVPCCVVINMEKKQIRYKGESSVKTTCPFVKTFLLVASCTSISIFACLFPD
jgi:hypothetical protein